MNTFSRRYFLRSAGTGTAAVSGLMLITSNSHSFANERIRHAVIGIGNQGRHHCERFAKLNNCEVVAVCDVDPERRKRAADILSDTGRVDQYEDYRRIIDDDSIDTISVTTPDHWHTPIALAAILAGKHVYVEKPCCHNINEGKLLVKAADKYNKCVQHGTQSRSGQGIRNAMQFLHEGKLGKVRLAKAINHQHRGPIGKAPVSDPPPGVNYDLWLGPAPKHPFTKNRWHYNWHWFWDYGTGDIGNDGIHQIDVARWGLGVDLPHAVSSTGGQLYYDDDHQTPDTQSATYEYDDCYLMFEMRLWTRYKLEGHDNGTIFYGEKGILEVGRNGCEVTFINEPKQKIGGGSDFDENARNFLQCVKNNAPSQLNAPLQEGFRSAALSHLGNIGTRVGRKLNFDTESCTFIDDSEANSLLTRNYRKGYELPII